MNKKMISAICILVICFAVPLLTLAGSKPCPYNCGSYNTNVIVRQYTPTKYDATYHKMHTDVVIHCNDCGRAKKTVKTEYESHTFNSKAGKKWPGFNCKEVVYTCSACKYSYTKYMPIDPKKPYAIPQ